ncbi:hypothetical protein LTR17_026750 [Elasticomyces elasticus]|nr:hypothetical protein LTR17_026750 [Elasticomyces elasticus]
MAQQPPTPNYIDPPERTWLPAFTSTLFALATVLLALRIWLRFTQKAGGFGLDDILMLCAWLFGLMYTILAIISAETYHIGRNNWDIPPQDYEPIALLGWLTQLAFLTSGACTKIAVLLFYRRLVKDTFDSRWRVAVFAGIGFIATYTVAIILVVILRCSPVDAAWRHYAPGYSAKYECVDTTAVNFLELTQVANVTRMVYNATACSQFELQLGIICASLPALRVFLRRRRGAVTSTSRTTRPDSSVPTRGGRIAVPKVFNDMDLPEEDKTEVAGFYRSGPMREGEGEGEQRERDVSTFGTDDSGVEEMEMEMPPRSPTGTANSTKPLVPLMRVGSPEEYEAYNLKVLKKGRTRYEREEGGSRDG